MPTITTNTAANSALRYLNINSDDQTTALNRIASGSKITSASDDAAGLALSMKLQSDVAVLDQAATNASHATAMLETADGALAEVADILERMEVLATSSLSGAVESERAEIDAEYQLLAEELQEISENTEFNGTTLLDGTYSGSEIDGTVSTQGTASVSIGNDAGTDIAEGDTLSITYGGETISITSTGGITTLQDDIDAAMAEYGYEAGTITSSVSGTNLVLTDSSTQNALTAASWYDDSATATETGTLTAASTSTGATTGAESTITFSLDEGEITEGDTVAFTVTIGDETYDVSFEIEDVDATSIEAQMTAALDEAGIDTSTYTLNATYTSGATGGDVLTISTDVGDTTIDLSDGVYGNSDGDSDGSASLDFMVGSSSEDIISVTLTDVGTDTLGYDAEEGTVAIAETSVATEEGATEALESLEVAIDQIAEARAELGAQMSRFEYRSDTLATSEENLDAAQSAVADADIAEEQANLSSAQVLTNAAIAALAQANEMPQDLLKLVQ